MIVNGSHTLTITTKLSILDACSGSCHVSKRLLSIKLSELYFALLQSGFQSAQNFISQPRITCSTVSVETPEKKRNMFEVKNKDTKTTPAASCWCLYS